jgi:uncharacterized protein YcbK (DUF882 family)
MPSSEHFSDKELACPHCGVNGTTQEIVDALEELRTHIGKPITVTSGYRCPEHNAAVGGAPSSQHMLGLAADILVPGMSASDLETAARHITTIKGIGRNDHANFLHVDVRKDEASWCYNEAGQQIPYYFPTLAT